MATPFAICRWRPACRSVRAVRPTDRTAIQTSIWLGRSKAPLKERLTASNDALQVLWWGRIVLRRVMAVFVWRCERSCEDLPFSFLQQHRVPPPDTQLLGSGVLARLSLQAPP